MDRAKNIIQNFFFLFIGLIFAFIILEIYLRVYEPFELRVKGEKIILPINKKYIVQNDKTEKLDSNIIHTKNSLGFRGKDPPKEFENYLTMLTVGGSTTECFYASDGKTWTDVLGNKLKNNFNNIWINNAGLVGQSTFGHIVLMDDYIVHLKPKVVLFLIGSNDRSERRLANKYDKSILKRSYSGTLKGAFKQAVSYSEVLGTILNIYRYIKSRNMGLLHSVTNYKTLEYLDIPQADMNKHIKNIQKTALTPLKERLKKLIQLSRENGIEPIFITQPALYGYAIDDVTNVDLARIRLRNTNGALVWERLEHVNNTIKKIGEDNNVFVIDLSKELPKSSKYYYDFLHFSNEGNKLIAQIIYNKLCHYLEDKYNAYIINECVIQ